jgi:hypothetical protein
MAEAPFESCRFADLPSSLNCCGIVMNDTTYKEKQTTHLGIEIRVRHPQLPVFLVLMSTPACFVRHAIPTGRKGESTPLSVLLAVVDSYVLDVPSLCIGAFGREGPGLAIF